MIVAITDGRANISLKRSTDPEAAAASDAPKPSSSDLKVKVVDLATEVLNLHSIPEGLINIQGGK